MADHMDRRQFLAGVAGAAGFALTARAQTVPERPQPPAVLPPVRPKVRL